MEQGYELEVHPGAPLIISFAFNFGGKEPEPYFSDRLKRIEQLSGKTLSKLFVQDRRSYWYTRGCDGMGDLQSTVARIQQICRDIQPSAVITMGESMGGYGALLYGCLLQADSVIAFAPTSFFASKLAETYGDMRYHSKMVEAGHHDPDGLTDVALMAAKYHFKGHVAIPFGTKPPVAHVDAVGMDAMHAWRIKHFFPQTELLPFAQAGHLVAIHMREQKILNDFLISRIPGLSMTLPLPTLRGVLRQGAPSSGRVSFRPFATGVISVSDAGVKRAR